MGLFRPILLLAGMGFFPCAAYAVPPEAPAATCAALDTAPNSDPAEEYNRAVKALDIKCYTIARKAFEGVLAASEGGSPVFLAEANFLAGRSAVGMRDHKAARDYFEKAIKLNGDMIAAHRELGLVYLRMGEKALAQAQLAKLKSKQQQCASSCPQSREIGSAISALNAAIANPAQAYHEVRPSMIFTDEGPATNSYVEAIGLINEGRYEDALVSLSATLEAVGPHPDILTYLGFANRKLHRYDIAEGYYRAALDAAPDHRGATEYYGELMVERGDAKGAKVMLARLEANCTFGCAEADELRRWIEDGPRAAR